MVSGLVFLHGNKIVHLDIKPQNPLYTNRFSLQITDFDLAMQMETDRDEISIFCRSKGWMAPEIGHKDVPRPTYSPFAADRFFAVVFFLSLGQNSKLNNELEMFAKRCKLGGLHLILHVLSLLILLYSISHFDVLTVT